MAARYGPIFVGVVFNILLYGIMITQTFLYFTVYKKCVILTVASRSIHLISAQGSPLDEALRESLFFTLIK